MLTEARRVAADIGELLGVQSRRHRPTGRAVLMKLPEPGRVSAGGATRLLPAADGWCAIALPRDDDVAVLPALLEVDAVTEPWGELSHWAATHSAADVIARTRLLDIASAALGEACAGCAHRPIVRCRHRTATSRRPPVADLSSLWAGPLCGQLLARAGAVVVKVESPNRPDGTRRGEPTFFDWVNGGKLSYAVDFDSGALHRLLGVADIVIEGSRPAALRRRRLDRRQCAGSRRAESGCASGAITTNRTDRPSVTMRRSRVPWSVTDRCSSATQSPIRSADWKRPAR